MKYYLILLLMLCLGIFSRSFAQIYTDSIPENNYTIFSSLVEKGLSSLSDKMTIIGSGKIYYVDNPGQRNEIRFMSNILKQKKQNFKFIENNLNSDSVYTISFTDVSLITRYSNVRKSSIIKRELGREIAVKFKCKIYFRDSLIYSYYFDNKSDDKFDYTYLNYVEAGDMPFFKGEVPEASFWDKYLIPVAAVSASVIAVILFFVIRSK